MTPTKSLASLIAVAALAFTATPALAQHRGGGRSSGHATSGHAEAQHSARTTPSRSFSGARVGGSSAPRAVAAAPSRWQSNARVIEPRRSSYVRVAPRILGSTRVIRPRFSNPYYTFRPRFSVGLGLSVGYPVALPYYDVNPYGYDPYYNSPAYVAPYSYAAPYLGGPDPGYASPGYASPGYTTQNYDAPAPAPYYGSSSPGAPTAPGSLGVQPGAAAGGLSFDISPAGAELFVDGRDVGPASNFAPTSEPLTLAPGRHHVELRATGRETMAFDSDVIAGQVIPYQGAMQAPAR